MGTYEQVVDQNNQLKGFSQRSSMRGTICKPIPAVIKSSPGASPYFPPAGVVSVPQLTTAAQNNNKNYPNNQNNYRANKPTQTNPVASENRIPAPNNKGPPPAPAVNRPPPSTHPKLPTPPYKANLPGNQPTPIVNRNSTPSILPVPPKPILPPNRTNLANQNNMGNVNGAGAKAPMNKSPMVAPARPQTSPPGLIKPVTVPNTIQNKNPTNASNPRGAVLPPPPVHPPPVLPPPPITTNNNIPANTHINKSNPIPKPPLVAPVTGNKPPVVSPATSNHPISVNKNIQINPPPKRTTSNPSIHPPAQQTPSFEANPLHPPNPTPVPAKTSSGSNLLPPSATRPLLPRDKPVLPPAPYKPGPIAQNNLPIPPNPIKHLNAPPGNKAPIKPAGTSNPTVQNAIQNARTNPIKLPNPPPGHQPSNNLAAGKNHGGAPVKPPVVRPVSVTLPQAPSNPIAAQPPLQPAPKPQNTRPASLALPPVTKPTSIVKAAGVAPIKKVELKKEAPVEVKREEEFQFTMKDLPLFSKSKEEGAKMPAEIPVKQEIATGSEPVQDVSGESFFENEGADLDDGYLIDDFPDDEFLEACDTVFSQSLPDPCKSGIAPSKPIQHPSKAPTKPAQPLNATRNVAPLPKPAISPPRNIIKPPNPTLPKSNIPGAPKNTLSPPRAGLRVPGAPSGLIQSAKTAEEGPCSQIIHDTQLPQTMPAESIDLSAENQVEVVTETRIPERRMISPMLLAQNCIPTQVNLNLISSAEFSASETTNDILVEVYEVHGGKKDVEQHHWVFPLKNYDYLVKNLRQIPYITVHPLPQQIIDVFIRSQGRRQEKVSLDRIPAQLLSQLMPYQKEGVLFVLQKGGRAMICDEMGLGKTLQAITICCCYKNEVPILVICPSSVRYSWRDVIFPSFSPLPFPSLPFSSPLSLRSPS